jgi:hypothetical protein
MPERTTITETVQIGMEATPGVSVPATTRLRTIGFTFDPEFNVRVFRPSGSKFPAIAAPGKEWMGGAVEGAADYNELIYPISMILGVPTSEPAGTGHKHTWLVSPSAIQDPKTATAEIGSAVRAEKSSGLALNDFGITYNRDEVNVDGAAIGKALVDGITLTPDVALVPLNPVLPQHVSVYFDAAHAALGTTKLLRVLEAAHQLTSRFGALWPLDAAQPSYVTLYEIEPGSEARLVQVADAAGMAHLPRARSGATGYLRIEAVGPVIGAGPDTYKLTVDLPVKVTDFGYGDSDGLKTAEWTFQWFDDEDAANAGQIELTNEVASL